MGIYLKMSLAYLKKNKLRTSLLTLGVALGVALIFGTRSPVFRLFALCKTSLNPSPRSKKTSWNLSSLGWPTQTLLIM